MRRGLDDIGKAREVLFLLQQRKLARQEDNERDLHDLGGLNGDGKILQKADAEPFADVVHAEPGAVAVSRQAKGRAQQQNEAEVERQQPLPFFSDLRHVDAGEQEVEQHAQQQAKSLNGNIFKGIAEMRGARDEHHAVERGNGDSSTISDCRTTSLKKSRNLFTASRSLRTKFSMYFSTILPICKRTFLPLSAEKEL